MPSAELKKLALKWTVTLGLIFAGVFLMRRLHPVAWPIIAAAFAIPIGILWTSSLGEIVSKFFGNFFIGDGPEELKPLYSIAQSQRNRGLYKEAIYSIQEQLDKFPGDFTGLLLIATIQAEEMNNLAAAQLTIEQLLATPHRSPQAVSSALQAMADWNLRYGQNPEGARAALQRIIDICPNTQFAQVAAQRIAHLPSAEELTSARDRIPIHLPTGQKDIGLQTTSQPMLPEIDPAAVAAGYIKQLEKYPLDSETREKLALLYAAHFQRVDLAVDQLDQLIAQSNVKPVQTARWLDLLATVHLRYGKDLASAEKALQQIVARFPDSAAAQMATSRIFILKSELKTHENPQSKKMGNYERNLGLKRPT